MLIAWTWEEGGYVQHEELETVSEAEFISATEEDGESDILFFPGGAVYDPFITKAGHTPWRNYGRHMSRAALLSVRRHKAANRRRRAL